MLREPDKISYLYLFTGHDNRYAKVHILPITVYFHLNEKVISYGKYVPKCHLHCHRKLRWNDNFAVLPFFILDNNLFGCEHMYEVFKQCRMAWARVPKRARYHCQSKDALEKTNLYEMFCTSPSFTFSSFESS